MHVEFFQPSKSWTMRYPKNTRRRSRVSALRMNSSHRTTTNGTSGTSNSNLQEPLRVDPLRRRQGFPTISMVGYSTTSRAYIKFIASIATNPSSVSIRVHVWATQLRPKSIRAARMQGGSPHDAEHARHVGRAYSEWILHWKLAGTLPMPCGLHHSHQKPQGMPDGIFQAQVPHATVIHNK